MKERKVMKPQGTPKANMMAEHGSKAPVTMTKHDQLIRREPNHNVHVITHHGNIQSGRKGRTGSK